MDDLYSFAPTERDVLAAAVVMRDSGPRQALLSEGFQHSSKSALISILNDFIGMALLVEENSRNWLDVQLICEGNMTERQARDCNIPTLQGALEGVRRAIKPTKGMCGSCAFRLGSVPNQCLPTLMDATYAAENCANFMCHESEDEDMEPTSLCAGFAHERAAAMKEANRG